MNEEIKEPRKIREDGRTDAFYAVQKDKDGNCSVLHECLDDGVDPNAVDLQGDTALHWACWNLRIRPMEVLLQRGATPNVQNYKGHTPLHHVINRDRNRDTFEMASSLLAAGADPLLPDKQGYTAYHALMQRSRMLQAREAMGLVELLSEKGGTDGWFQEDIRGMTPLDIARETNDDNLAAFVASLQGSILERNTAKVFSPSSSRRL